MARRAGILLLLLLAAAPGSAEPFRVCGEDHDYRFEPPPGWKLASDDNAALSLRSFTPMGGTLASDGALLTLGRSYQEVDVDFDEAFELGVAAFVVQQDLPDSIGEPKLQHPTLASPAVRFDSPKKQIVTVMVDPRNGRGLLLALTLTHVGDALPPERLAQLEASLASLRFDAAHVCKRGPDGAPREETAAAPAPAPATPKAAALTPQLLALRKATAVCTWLQRAEMPVRCERGLLRGKPVVLARFQDRDSLQADQLMEAFRPPIARVYCWVAADHALPQLAFYAQDFNGTAPIVTWSCQTRTPEGGAPFESYQPDRSTTHARATS